MFVLFEHGIRDPKLMWKRWTGHVAHESEMEEMHTQILVGILEGKGPP